MHFRHHRRGSTRFIGAPGGIINILTMFFVGLLLAGMGVVFVGIGATVPILRSSFFLTGGILVPVGLGMFAFGVYLWMRRANAQRLRASGVPGQAQIVGMTQTNMFVNYQPVVELQLSVTTPMHSTYAVTRRETVPQIYLGRLTNGAPLPVMVDATNPMNLIILWDTESNLPSGFGG